jgi:hypothetical protein
MNQNEKESIKENDKYIYVRKITRASFELEADYEIESDKFKTTLRIRKKWARKC